MSSDTSSAYKLVRRGPTGAWHADQTCSLSYQTFAGNAPEEVRHVAPSELEDLERTCVCVTLAKLRPRFPDDGVRTALLSATAAEVLEARLAGLAGAADWATIGAARLHAALATTQGVPLPASRKGLLSAATTRAAAADPVQDRAWVAAVRLVAAHAAPPPLGAHLRLAHMAGAFCGRGVHFSELLERWVNATLEGGYGAGERAVVDAFWLTQPDPHLGAGELTQIARLLATSVENGLAQLRVDPLGDELLVLDLDSPHVQQARERGQRAGAACFTPRVLEAFGRGGVVALDQGARAATKIPALEAWEVADELGIDRPSGAKGQRMTDVGLWFGRIPDDAPLAELAELAWALCSSADGPDVEHTDALGDAHEPDSPLARPRAATKAALAILTGTAPGSPTKS